MLSIFDTRRHLLLYKIIVVFLFFLPAYSYAAVSISEIMYDPPGTDDGHEWIEVYNDGAPVDLSKWKLFEGGSNHSIAAYAGGSMLQTGAYAVLADVPTKFLADNPSFSGQLFDTVFSGGLNNTNGETLTLRNDSAVDVDTITYNPLVGGEGDGNSLQKVGTSWVAAPATPGVAPSAAGESSGSNSTNTEANQSSNNTSSSAQTSTNTSTTTPTSYPVEPQMSVSAGSDRTVVVGASSVFSAHAFGLKGDLIPDARIVWSFGNGEQKEGQSVLYSFPYPGTYLIIATAASGYFSATDRITITAVPAHVVISRVTPDFVELTNHSNVELDIGLWQLSADGATFMFPAHTVILPNEAVSISNIATGLKPSAPSAVQLLYPNGMLAAAYGTDLIMARAPVAPSVPGVVSVRGSTQPQTRSLSTPFSQDLAAAPIAAVNPGVPSGASMPLNIIPWIIGLVAVTGIGIASALLLRQSGGTTTGTGYTIIEDES